MRRAYARRKASHSQQAAARPHASGEMSSGMDRRISTDSYSDTGGGACHWCGQDIGQTSAHAIQLPMLFADYTKCNLCAQEAISSAHAIQLPMLIADYTKCNLCAQEAISSASKAICLLVSSG
jgi:hypothetical protein